MAPSGSKPKRILAAPAAIPRRLTSDAMLRPASCAHAPASSSSAMPAASRAMPSSTRAIVFSLAAIP
jgi:hypothetical protein